MISPKNFERIDPEQVAYWFFRLNGCPTIINFIVHPDFRGPSQRTDVDILAVRFPHRAELITSGHPMVDHEVFCSEKYIDIAIAEVKHGQCRLNGPWTNPPDANLHRVLYAIGVFDEGKVPDVSKALYQDGQFKDDQYRVRLFAIGEFSNPRLLPGAVQLVWDEVLKFIYGRFREYQVQKAHHTQWENIGDKLFRIARNTTEDDFRKKIMNAMQEFVNHKNRPTRNQITGIEK